MRRELGWLSSECIFLGFQPCSNRWPITRGPLLPQSLSRRFVEFRALSISNVSSRNTSIIEFAGAFSIWIRCTLLCCTMLSCVRIRHQNLASLSQELSSVGRKLTSTGASRVLIAHGNSRKMFEMSLLCRSHGYSVGVRDRHSGALKYVARAKPLIWWACNALNLECRGLGFHKEKSCLCVNDSCLYDIDFSIDE